MSARRVEEGVSKGSGVHGRSQNRNAGDAAAAYIKWSKNGFGQSCRQAPLNGKFTPSETALVRSAIDEYCTRKNITAARLCSECHHKAELKGAWTEIARKVPHRTVQSVYRHGLRQLHPFQRGPWTDAECNTLLEYVVRYGRKWSTIQAKIHRPAQSCRDKYREISTDYLKGPWNQEDTETFKRLVGQHLRADPNADITELANIVERDRIVLPWGTISMQFGKRGRLACLKKWQTMTSIGTPAPASPEASKDAESTDVGNCQRTGEPISTVTSPKANNNSNDILRDKDVTHAQMNQGDDISAAATAFETVSSPLLSSDRLLLSALADSCAKRLTDVQWSAIRCPLGSALDRWNTLLDEAFDEEEDEFMDKPIFELAAVLLERMQND